MEIHENAMVDLTKYSHNRDADFKKSSHDLLDVIDKFADQDQLSDLYDHFERKYSLPKSVIKQKLKRHIAALYIYKKASFRKELSLRWVPLSIVKHFGLLFYTLIHSRRCANIGTYKLMVDGIASNIELHRFKKLIDLFGKKEVLIITTSKGVEAEFPDYNITFFPNYKHYDITEVLRSIRHELLSGIWLYASVSIRLRVNLFFIATLLVKDYLHYLTLFKTNRSDYIIQERHYGTSSVKNYLFKKFGGRISTSLQKDILQMDTLNYYCDIDCLFSLGNRTAERVFEYGGRIGQVVSVGSLFMEYYWFNDPVDVDKKFDVVMLGINTMNAYERMDSYSKFMDDYYDSIRWLVRFKNEHPFYRIAIKHHSSAGEDKIENEMISGSGVEMLAKTGNSYKIAFSSRCAVTYGSTM
jgi:hypothetical protein